MQIIKNISWNFFSGIWLAAITVLVTPLYVSKLGLNLYSVIGLWLIFQAIMNLFDFGLGASLTKELSSVKLFNGELIKYSDILRTIEMIYWSISAIFVIILIITFHFFLKDWISVKFIKIENISSIILLMLISIFFQFPNLLYLNGLIGLQEHKLASLLQIIGNTLKFGLGAIIFLKGTNLYIFFCVQIFVSFLQTFMARYYLWKHISIIEPTPPLFNVKVLKKVATFSKQMALTSIIAVLLSNTDKLLVFKMLNAEDLSRYSIAFTATGFLQLAIQPFYRSFFPRYSELFSKEKHNELESEYFFSNRLISFLIISLAVICFVFANELFYVWMGNTDPVVLKVFRFLICGIMLSGLGWLPAAFQQAIGWPELHVKMMLISFFIAIPVLIFSINYIGIIGASFIWLIHGVIDLTIGLWIMHKKVFKGKFKMWYLKIFIPPFFYSIPISLVSKLLLPETLSRVNTLVWVAVTSLFNFTIVAISIKKSFFEKLNENE